MQRLKISCFAVSRVIDGVRHFIDIWWIWRETVCRRSVYFELNELLARLRMTFKNDWCTMGPSSSHSSFFLLELKQVLYMIKTAVILTQYSQPKSNVIDLECELKFDRIYRKNLRVECAIGPRSISPKITLFPSFLRRRRNSSREWPRSARDVSLWGDIRLQEHQERKGRTARGQEGCSH